MKAITLIFIMSITAIYSFGQKHPYQNQSLPVEQRVNDLLKRMTLPEKVAELNLVPYYEQNDAKVKKDIREGKIGALLKANGAARNRSLQEEAMKHSRLGIPLMFHEDVIHGYRTITPIPLAESCSWNPELVAQSSAMAAKEATAAGIQLTYAPMVDISNDPRWGRIMETSGEDAFLGSVLARARVEGFQGKNANDPNTVAACVKHFAGYGALLGGCDYQNTDFSLRDLQERYLPPFQAAIDAGVKSVMCSYTSYDGEPVTMNYFMNTEILRKQMGFKGLFMTDWTTFNHAVSEGAAANGKEAAERGMLSGIEMDMSSWQYHNHLSQLVKEKKIPMKQLDNAVAHALKLKFEAGLFDHPYQYFDTVREQRTLLSEESKKIAYEMAAASMVLLKNKDNALPLKSTGKIALIGPFVTNKADFLGSWSMKGVAEEVVSVLEGFSSNQDISRIFALGCEQNGVSNEFIASATTLAQKSDIVIVCVGESCSLIGEAVTTARISIPQEQIKLVKALKKTGKQVITVLFNGRPLVLDEILQNSDALLEAWYPGTMGGQAVADILTGKINPSAKLTQTFPRHSGQIPISYNQRRTFGYIHHADIPQGAEFPFGYGLSYTNYIYSGLEAERDSIRIGTPVKIKIRVKNNGKYAGREVVQLYIRDEVASIVPREKELKGFQSVILHPGEEKTVTFNLTPELFTLYNNKMQKVTEPGAFQIMVGPNSADLQRKKMILY